VGNSVTIADIAVAAPMHVHKWQRLPLNDHPNLKRWMADIEQLPCWEKTRLSERCDLSDRYSARGAIHKSRIS
jgi:glutathione S-transferase